MNEINELLQLAGNLKDCPWGNWRGGTLRFCEAHQCEWIVAPAETWSNLPYFFVGFFLLIQGWRATKAKTGRLNSVSFRFGIYAVLIGICSGLFHASHTFFFETLDLAAMFLLGIEMILQALKRLQWLKGRSPTVFALVFYTGAVFTLGGAEGAERLWIFTAMMVIVVALEGLFFVQNRRLGETPLDYSPFIQSLAIFAVAYAFWFVDYEHILCNPDQHYWSGHAVWHVLNSLCFLTLARFYEPMSTLAPPRATG